MSATTARRNRTTTRDFGVKLDPRITCPPEILSQTPLPKDNHARGLFTPGSSWNSLSGGSHSERSAKGNTPNSTHTCPTSTHPMSSSVPSSLPSSQQSSHRETSYPTPQQGACHWRCQSSPSLDSRSPVACAAIATLAASCILPNLYLGGERDTFYPEVLHDHGISYILNLAEECHPFRGLADQCTFVGDQKPQVDETIPFWTLSCGGDETPQTMRSPDLTDGDFEMHRTGTFPFVPSSSPSLGQQKLQPTCESDCQKRNPTSSCVEKRFTYMYVPLKDNVDVDIQPYFESCGKFIRDALQQSKGILVHCRVGVSRSAAMVIAYLMQYGWNLKKPSKVSFDVAYHRVATARPMINPNIAFGYALRSLDQTHKFRSDVLEPSSSPLQPFHQEEIKSEH